jgi:hypothetical protein
MWGAHDDRLVALLLGIWASNEWNFENAPEEAAGVIDVSKTDYQCTDLSYDEMVTEANEKFSRLTGDF